MKEKELKSKIREHKLYGKQYSYILDSINPDNIDIDGENMSDKERLIVLLKDFDRCANYEYNQKAIPSIIRRFADWTQGLPSVFTIAFEYHNIIKIGKSWYSFKSERQEETFCEKWFYNIAVRVFQLADYFRINYDNYNIYYEQ